MTAAAAIPLRREIPRLLRDSAGLLVLAALLGASVNALRPRASRLPWVGDWERHIEPLAFRAGIPVVFLLGMRDRLADPATLVFDARGPAEYAAGHLPGALSLPVAYAEIRLAALVHRLTPSTPLVVYCGGGDCEDALDLARKLRELGFEDLTLYPGGFAEWTAYGGAVETGNPS